MARRLAVASLVSAILIVGVLITRLWLTLRVVPDQKVWTALAYDKVDDANVRRWVHQFPNLEIFSLQQCKRVTDAGLEPVRQLQSLRELNLGLTEIGDGGIEHLRDMRTLRRLSLWGNPISDRALDSIGTLTGLEDLSLDGTSITSSATSSLRNLKALKYLTLARTRVDDRTLEDIADLTNLEFLDLSDTKISAAGLKPPQAVCIEPIKIGVQFHFRRGSRFAFGSS